ncbi:MAG TPA: acyltransferase [Methylocystis sp.]|nr:acyltransferase [Methylocystis sp.]
MSFGSDKLASPGAFRLILAFAVFVHHTTNFNLGLPAVLIFFVLSGYWVATMWSNTYSKTAWAYLTYLISRVWRLIPVFALCSAISWALLYWRGVAPDAVGGVWRQLLSNVMILGYNSLSYQANVPAWSLDMEMQFYLIAPAIIFLLSRNIFFLALCALVTIASQKLGGAVTVAPFVLFFGIGAASACGGLQPSRKLAYGSLFATLAVLAVGAAVLAKNVALDPTQPAPLAFGSTTSLAIAMLMVPWALYTTRQKGGAHDRMLGDLSYIFYLLHWSVIGALKTGEGSYVERLALCSEALVLIFVVSYLIWRLFDHPINKLRAAWVSGRRALYEEAMTLTTAEPPQLAFGA